MMAEQTQQGGETLAIIETHVNEADKNVEKGKNNIVKAKKT